MKHKGFVLSLIVLVCLFVVSAGLEDQASAAQKKKVKDQAPPAISVKPSIASPKPARTAAQSRSSTSVAPPSRSERTKALSGEAKQPPASSKALRKKSSRRAKGKKKIRLKAVVRPRTDLMHHGMLEDAGRYDPRPNYRTAGVPNPHARYLLYDHFQELDHNQDGKIDPIERAVGRLDMDRDLHNRRPQ